MVWGEEGWVCAVGLAGSCGVGTVVLRKEGMAERQHAL